MSVLPDQSVESVLLFLLDEDVPEEQALRKKTAKFLPITSALDDEMNTSVTLSDPIFRLSFFSKSFRFFI